MLSNVSSVKTTAAIAPAPRATEKPAPTSAVEPQAKPKGVVSPAIQAIVTP